MSQTNKILEYAASHKGVVTSRDADSLGVPRMILKYLLDGGKLVKLSRGVYGLPEATMDEFYENQKRCSKGIYCLDSALFLLGYIEDKPHRLSMAFPKTYNTTKVKNRGIIAINENPADYGLGVLEIATPRSNKVNCYCIERSIAECFAYPGKADKLLLKEAFRKYVSSHDANIDLLKTYAKMFGVDGVISIYLDAIL